MRNIDIFTPNKYTGYSGHDEHSYEFSYKHRHFFINGYISAEDGAFLSGFFVKQIGHTNICIGPYPLYPIDVDQIAKAGVNAILNLQMQSEMF